MKCSKQKHPRLTDNGNKTTAVNSSLFLPTRHQTQTSTPFFRIRNPFFSSQLLLFIFLLFAFVTYLSFYSTILPFYNDCSSASLKPPFFKKTPLSTCSLVPFHFQISILKHNLVPIPFHPMNHHILPSLYAAIVFILAEPEKQKGRKQRKQDILHIQPTLSIILGIRRVEGKA